MRREFRFLSFASCLFIALGCDRSTSIETTSITSSIGAGAEVAGAEGAEKLVALQHPDRIQGRYIVRFSDDVRDPSSFARDIVAKTGGRILIVLRSLNGVVVELPDAALHALSLENRVRVIEADVRLHANRVQDTTQSAVVGPLDRMDQRSLPLDNHYSWSTDGTGVHIWIVDDGFNGSEPELAGRVQSTPQFVFNGQDPLESCFMHGTLMAINAAGRTSGVGRNAFVHSARINNVGTCTDWSSGAASAAIEFIADYSPRPAVINFSGSKDCWWIFCGNTVDDAVNYAIAHGVTVVVSAGNSGQDACGFSPAHVPAAITVASAKDNDARDAISNYGSCVDLFATTGDGAGTSDAASYVTGAIAAQLQLYPGSSPAVIRQHLLNNATGNTLSGIGAGSPNSLLYTRQRPMVASIVGPWLMGPTTACDWYADLGGGGQPPFSYQWTRNFGPAVGFFDQFGVSSGGPSDFTLQLQVVDGVGRTASTGKYITVDPFNTDYYCGGF